MDKVATWRGIRSGIESAMGGIISYSGTRNVFRRQYGFEAVVKGCRRIKAWLRFWNGDHDSFPMFLPLNMYREPDRAQILTTTDVPFASILVGARRVKLREQSLLGAFFYLSWC